MEQRETTSLWTIDELGREVARALAEDYREPANRQIRAIPDRRTIRYYTTLGLLDGPARMRGRTALYGRRHLLQVVAIKRLQARGMALASIQEELAGLPDAGLSSLARIPAAPTVERQGPRADEREDAAPRRQRQKFWGEVPTESPRQTTDNSAAQAPVAPATAPGAREPASRIARLTALSLAPGATLVLDAARLVSEEDLLAVETAATRLVDQLKTLGLLPEPKPECDPNKKGATP